MRVVFVSSEVVPFSKSGGLADVSHALPKFLALLGHEVHLVTPKYRSAATCGAAMEDTGVTLKIPIAFRTEEARIFRSGIGGPVTVHLVENDELYDREGLYGNEYGDYEDNAERFVFFSRAVLELCAALNLQPDVIHCNNWQTGLVPTYLKSLYCGVPGLERCGSVFTVHDLGNQGLFGALDLALTGLGWEFFTMERLEFYGNLNFMKGGLVFADRIVTVSRKYGEEILSPEFGCGLEGVFQHRRADLRAVLNGVDYDHWDPARDPYIATPYSRRDLRGKSLCKKDLMDRCGLARDGSRPLVAMISSLETRKGLDLLEQVFPGLMDLDMRVLIMGKGEDRYHGFLMEMCKRYRGKTAVFDSYEYETAHRIHAGADFLLVPSRYEPCGLEQLYGLRYGTIPLVRATGGLDETVAQYDPETGQGTGFKFREYTPDALLTCFHEALRVYGDDVRWERLVRNAMEEEFPWSHSAKEYERIYDEVVRPG